MECLNLSVGDRGDRTDCTDRLSGETSDRPDCMEAASMSPRLARVTEDSVERSAAEVSDVLARDAREPPTPPRLLTSSMLHSREYLEPEVDKDLVIINLWKCVHVYLKYQTQAL